MLGPGIDAYYLRALSWVDLEGRWRLVLLTIEDDWLVLWVFHGQ